MNRTVDTRVFGPIVEPREPISLSVSRTAFRQYRAFKALSDASLAALLVAPTLMASRAVPMLPTLIFGVAASFSWAIATQLMLRGACFEHPHLIVEIQQRLFQLARINSRVYFPVVLTIAVAFGLVEIADWPHSLMLVPVGASILAGAWRSWFLTGRGVSVTVDAWR